MDRETTAEGEVMTGAQCFGSIAGLYGVAGGIRNNFISLQDAVIQAQSKQQPR